MAKPTKPSRRPAPAQEAESHYESFQRMAWIDEGGIDLRAARANLLEFIAGLYEEALKVMNAPQPRAAPARAPRQPTPRPATKKPAAAGKQKKKGQEKRK